MSTNRSSFKQFIVVCGDNDYAIDRDIEQAGRVKRRVIKLNGDGMTEGDLVEQCCTYGEPITVILDNAEAVKVPKAKPKKTKKVEEDVSPFRRFIESRDSSDQMLSLVAVVRGGGKLPDIWELVAEKGVKYQRSLPKPWEDNAYTDFIAKEAFRHKISIDPKAVKLLHLYAGNDFYQLSNEVRKLSLYIDQGTITPEHVALVTTRTPRAEPHTIATATLSKERKKAFDLFSIFYSNEGDQGCIGLTVSLMSQVERLVEIKSLQAQSLSSQDIASLMKIKQYPYDTQWAPMASKHDLPSLVGHMGQLAKLDSYVKLGHSKRTMMELTMLSISK